MRSLFFVGLLAVSSLAVSAEECISINDGQKRLACYDMKYKPVVKTESVGKWVVTEEVSKIDDSKSVFMQVSSGELVKNRLGQSANASLTVRCMEHKTSLIVQMAGSFLADVGGYGKVTYRIDNQKAETRSFSSSTDNEALGLWSGGDAIPLIKSMLDHDVMIFRVTPYNQSAETVTFPITGLKTAIEPLRKACKW